MLSWDPDAIERSDRLFELVISEVAQVAHAFNLAQIMASHLTVLMVWRRYLWPFLPHVDLPIVELALKVLAEESVRIRLSSLLVSRQSSRGLLSGDDGRLSLLLNHCLPVHTPEERVVLDLASAALFLKAEALVWQLVCESLE